MASHIENRAGVGSVEDGAPVSFLVDAQTFRSSLLADVARAEQRVWVSIAFFDAAVELDGRGVMEVLQEAAERGVDVRVLAWDAEFVGLGTKSSNLNLCETHVALVSDKMPDVRVAWDPSPSKVHCHHTKDWVVDNVSYIGGINLKVGQHKSLFPGSSDTLYHDNYARVADRGAWTRHCGFFTARWNAVARREDAASRMVPSVEMMDEAPWVVCDEEVSSFGEQPQVRFLSTVMKGLYSPHPDPTAAAIDLSGGSETILEWYMEAFDAAKDWILVESTHVGHVPLLERVLAALDRGVRVLWVHGVWPTIPESNEVRHYRAVRAGDETQRTRYTRVFELCIQAAQHPLFTHASLLGEPSDDPSVYDDRLLISLGKCGRIMKHLHSKLTVVDGTAWITGSANHVDLSFSSDPGAGHTETAVGVHDPVTAAAVLSDIAIAYGLPVTPTPADFVANATQHALANRDAAIAGRAPVGNLIAIDLEWAFTEMPDPGPGQRFGVKVFPGWFSESSSL